MARNEDIEVFGIPQINKQRYYHHFTGRRKSTCNLGDILPVACTMLVQPGDTLSLSARTFLRLTTSLFPSMDNLTADIFCFAEDWQNVWDHTKEFWGEDEATPFEIAPEYTVPKMVFLPTDEIEHNDIIHHLRMPQMKANQGTVETETRNQNIEIERLTYNAYLDIYNRYFRDQNYIKKYDFSKGDEDINYAKIKQKKLLKAARFNDYFAGAPEAQKGEPEKLPIGTSAPVMTGKETTHVNAAAGIIENPKSAAIYVNGTGINSQLVTTPFDNVSDRKSNLYTDLTNTVAATINALRLVTATQHIKEQLMWYGSRFEEIIFSQWGVSMDALSMRIPEYLGGKRINLNMDTVLQTSSTDTESPQGNAAGYSVTLDEDFMFTKSFTTWQIIMVLLVIRQDHSYAQGIEREAQKFRKYDYYWDEFAGLGAQPRMISEICVNGNNKDLNVWNFAPAWREYNSKVDRACGLMVPGIDNSLANYTYTDEYHSVPNSGEEWINETPGFLDRTLVVPSTTTDQFMIDMVFDYKLTSIVPNYRLPGIGYL